MKVEKDISRITSGGMSARLFWSIFIVSVICTIIGVLVGNPFVDYETASTL